MDMPEKQSHEEKNEVTVYDMVRNLSMNFAYERQRRRMTREQLANEAGVCAETVKRAEKGCASLWTALSLCKALEIDINEAVITPRKVMRISKTR